MPRNRSVRVFAPAKVNLTLHVTDQRADGYHLIDSLVAFADIGDELVIEPCNTVSLTTRGPEAAAVPAGTDNLVLQVANLFETLAGASLLLTKNLPVASGIGGGSADAAAAFRGLLLYLGEQDTPDNVDAEILSRMELKLLDLGADIPMCLRSDYARIRGIGEQIVPIENLPQLNAVLVNPRRSVPTPSVFNALECRQNPAMPETFGPLETVDAYVDWLAAQRNDMEPAAKQLEPEIAKVKSALAADSSCLLARMSGSGATCFGLYARAEHAIGAANALKADHPEWWIEATVLGTQTWRAMPKLS